jgi:hypothetical protein
MTTPADGETSAAMGETPTPKSFYVSQCKQHLCKPNSHIINLLSHCSGQLDFKELDLSTNFVGTKGIFPILEIVRRCPHLQKFIVRDNYLDNQAVHYVASTALEHPALTHLDVSNNPISWTAAMSLLDMVNKNPRIREVFMQGTFIKPEIVETINKKIENRKIIGALNQRPASSVARIRALKKLFASICATDGTGDKVYKKNIIRGFKENLLLQGEAEQAVRGTDFWVELQRRCNTDSNGMIDWETFLLVSMCNDVSIHPEDISRLRGEYKFWDKNHNGFIELSELKSLMTHINGSVPSNQEVVDKMMQFSDAEDEGQINWDDFIFMMYEWIQGAPTVGSYARVPDTALSAQKPPRYM